MSPYEVKLSRTAARDFEALDPVIARQVKSALLALAATRQGDVKKLKGASVEYRLRVGEWRVRFLFDHAERAIVVLTIRPRGRAYRD